MHERNEKHVEKHKLMITMDPEVAEIFARSTSVSSKYFGWSWSAMSNQAFFSV